jgi:protein TonB
VVSQTVAVAKASKPAETSGHGRDDSKSTGVDCSKREPVYPPRLKSRHVEGWVKVEFTVNTEGEVTDAVVVNSEPADIFDDAALNAVNKWDCRAKIVNGAAVPQRATQTFKFQLEN